MVAAVGNSQSVLAPSQSQVQSQSSAPGVSFQQAVAQYTQATTNGVGGTASATTPSPALSSDLMSSLLQMQS
jgi:hypothetical protein